MSNFTASIIGIDYGEKRVGVAIASTVALLARPLITLNNDDRLIGELKEIIKRENVSQIILGYPKNLDNKKTPQTAIIDSFAVFLKQHINVPVIFKEEALTSVKAKQELESLGKGYDKTAIDALAATYILEDWIKEDYKALTETNEVPNGS